jgi:hypothetical protein
VEDYRRDWLDRLGLAGEIVWTVFDPSAGAGRRGPARQRRLAAESGERPRWTPDQERAPAPPASRRLVRPRPRPRRGLEPRRSRPLCGSSSAPASPPRHLQRDRRRHGAAGRADGRPPARRAASGPGPRSARAPAAGRTLERAGRGGDALARGARGGPRPAPARPLRRADARAGRRRLGDAAPHAAAHGVWRRGHPRLLRRGLSASSMPSRILSATWPQVRVGRASRAGQPRGSGQPLGPRLAAVAPRRRPRERGALAALPG